MASLKTLWGRLAGFRLYLLAALVALPDTIDAVVALLDALTGFDWGTVLPDAWQGYGARIGGLLMLARIGLSAFRDARARRRRRRKRRGDPCEKDSHDA